MGDRAVPRPRRLFAPRRTGSGERRLAVAASLAVVSACSGGAEDSMADDGAVARVDSSQRDDGYAGTLLSDPLTGRPELSLLDTERRIYDLTADVDGVTALFFGYTQCSDICPTTMADLAAARRQLPQSQQQEVTVVFVTEDPANDTPEALRVWLDRFDTDFVGLMGGSDGTREALASLYLPPTERHVDPPGAEPHGDGEFEHGGVVYLFGPGDDATVVHTGGTTVAQYVSDFRQLLANG